MPYGTKYCRTRNYWDGLALHRRNTKHKKRLTENIHWIWVCAAVSVFCKLDEPLKIQIYIIKMQHTRRQQGQGSLLREHELRELPQSKRAASALNKADPKCTNSTKNTLRQWKGRSKVRSIHKDKVQQLPGGSITKPGVNPSWGAAWATAMLYRWAALLQWNYSKNCELRLTLKRAPEPMALGRSQLRLLSTFNTY